MHSIRSSCALYHKLILLTGVPGSGKTPILNEIAAHFQQSVINVNLAISEKLIGVSKKQRPLKISALINDLVGTGETPVILDNLEMLFDIELKQNPLHLLMNNARNRVVVASWSGTYKDGRLVYAEIGHSEYRIYDTQDSKKVLIVVTN